MTIPLSKPCCFQTFPAINNEKFQSSMVENSNHQWWKIPTINGGKFQPSMVE
jgi:hypothetical protein